MFPKVAVIERLCCFNPFCLGNCDGLQGWKNWTAAQQNVASDMCPAKTQIGESIHLDQSIFLIVIVKD